MDLSVSPKDEIWFLRVRHHISNAVFVIVTLHSSDCKHCSSSLCTKFCCPMKFSLADSRVKMWTFSDVSGPNLTPPPSSGCASGLVDPDWVLVLPNHRHTLTVGTELGPETSQNLHTLTRLSARNNFIEFCRRQSFKDLEFAVFNRHVSFTVDEVVPVLNNQTVKPCGRSGGLTSQSFNLGIGWRFVFGVLPCFPS